MRAREHSLAGYSPTLLRSCALLMVVGVITMSLANALTAQSAGRWVLLAAKQIADTADVVWVAPSAGQRASASHRVWLRHLQALTERSVDIVSELTVDCARGTTTLLATDTRVIPRFDGTVMAPSPDVRAELSDRTPGRPTAGSPQWAAFQADCAWLGVVASASRRLPLTIEWHGRVSGAWYAVPLSGSQRDTMHVDSADVRPVSEAFFRALGIAAPEGAALLSVWAKEAAHGRDRASLGTDRTAYVLEEFHVRCDDLRTTTVQLLAFDDSDVLLGVRHQPGAPLHATPQGTADGGAATLACHHTMVHQ
jgi:hypothetical protein